MNHKSSQKGIPYRFSQTRKRSRQIGKNIRTIQRQKTELEELGWLEQLSKGDKAIARYRVVKDPKERPKVRLANLQKIQERRIKKTPPATSMSQTRCGAHVAENMNREHDPLLSPIKASQIEPAKGSASKTGKELKDHRGPDSPSKAVKQGVFGSGRSQRLRRGDNWAYWAHWLERRYRIANGWLWITENSSKIQKALGIQGEDADRILEQCLFRAKSTKTGHSRLVSIVEEAIHKKKTQSIPKEASGL